MSGLSDGMDSIQKGLDEKTIEAVHQVEEVYGIVQCNECSFWGRMPGYIEPHDRAKIKFVCPECNSLEIVANPESVR